MEIITSRNKSFATPANAKKHLGTVADFDKIRWLIAVNPDGRYVPVVILDRSRPETLGLAHHGVTVVG